MNIKTWEERSLDKDRAARMAEEFGIPSFLAMLLEIRGFSGEEQVRDMLEDTASLSDPFLMKDMDRAVKRIRRAVDNFEKIAVYGDYDADGVTATAILFTYLEALGADVMYYIPKREGEGYGMNPRAVNALKDQGVELIVTVDNGISSLEEVDLANSLGMDVVVTDHHQPQRELPAAAAVVDAWREDDESPFSHFSGAGVVLKLLIALEDGESQGILEEYADLAALGTIGDVVPLLGENRTLVRAGLRAISRGGRPGLDALLAECSSNRAVTATTLAFTAIPRINATGRMGAPERAVRLLIGEEEEEAESLAQEICGDNEERRRVEGEILKEAMALLAQNPALSHDRVLVLSGKNWHHGVIGIVAARITERTGKPCFILSESGEEAKGSGRSVEGFPLFQAISACADTLTRFGGHPMAAGVSLKTENIPLFRKSINEYAEKAFPEMPAPVLRLDCRLNPASLSVDMPKALEWLEPFGNGNPQPVFGLFGMTIREIVPVGGGNHLRLICEKKGARVPCMRFGVKPEDFPFSPGAKVDLAVTLEHRIFRGEDQLTIHVREMKLSSTDTREALHSFRVYEEVLRGKALSPKDGESLAPTREELGVLYRKLVSLGGKPFGTFSLLETLPGFSLGKLFVCLDILEERGLIQKGENGEILSVRIVPVKNKVNIFESPVFQKLGKA